MSEARADTVRRPQPCVPSFCITVGGLCVSRQRDEITTRRVHRVHAVLAATPPVLALVLMLSRSFRPESLAAAILVLSIVVAVTAFGARLSDFTGEYVEISPTLLEVVLILFGGTLLNKQLTAVGAYSLVADWIQRFSADRSRSVLLICLGITPFAESVTGFGIGIVVAIPLLLGLGFTRFQAAALGLLGLVLVPWGALAPGTLVASELTGVGFDRLGMDSALLTLPVLLLTGLAALLIGCGRRIALRRLPELLFVAGVLWAGVLAAQAVAGTSLAGALGSLAGIAAAVALIWFRDGSGPRPSRAIGVVLSPYGLLLAGLLGSRLLLAVLGAQRGLVPTVVSSPAFWLLMTCAAAPWLLGGKARGSEPVVAAVRQWWPVALATALFLLVGATLTASGMSAELARTAARLGRPYVALAPWIGAMGGFLTGSTTGANAMFAASQAGAAHSLGYSVPTLVALHNVAGSLLTMASVPRVVFALELTSAGSSAAGSKPGRSSELHRLLLTILGVDAAVLLVFSVIALVA
ncbi:L-lactate permease [Streptomyces sp. NPDC056817]|uniref:L-lactate permease n=1 Tax=Streptomyces sp. NPDC056817 TaxID=3345950 RepID=UPI00368975D5